MKIYERKNKEQLMKQRDDIRAKKDKMQEEVDNDKKLISELKTRVFCLNNGIDLLRLDENKVCRHLCMLDEYNAEEVGTSPTGFIVLKVKGVWNFVTYNEGDYDNPKLEEVGEE